MNCGSSSAAHGGVGLPVDRASYHPPCILKGRQSTRVSAPESPGVTSIMNSRMMIATFDSMGASHTAVNAKTFLCASLHGLGICCRYR